MKSADIAAQLAREAGSCAFALPVTHVYNPLEYAWETHAAYLARYGSGSREILLVGMNPGPWGMAQTGVPFGDPVLVREWLGISGQVSKPAIEHPKRPILGMASPRREVSGTRLWGWARERFAVPEAFFARFFVHNYCPLCFMEASGRNFTPDKLPAAERAPLFAACDRALLRLIEQLRPEYLMGVGAFAEQRLRAAVPDYAGVIGSIPHPSPANPAANRNWAAAAETALRAHGIRL